MYAAIVFVHMYTYFFDLLPGGEWQNNKLSIYPIVPHVTSVTQAHTVCEGGSQSGEKHHRNTYNTHLHADRTRAWESNTNHLAV